MTSIKEEEVAKLLRIEEELHKRIISQDKAITALARAIRRRRAGLEVARTGPSARSCSSARRASARPKSRARWRSSCSAARSR